MAQGYKAQGNGTQIQFRPGFNTLPVQEPELLAIAVSWEQFTIFQPSSTNSNYSKYLVKMLWNFVIGRLCNLLLSFEYLQVKDLLGLNYKQGYFFIGKSARRADHERQRAEKEAGVGAVRGKPINSSRRLRDAFRVAHTYIMTIVKFFYLDS